MKLLFCPDCHDAHELIPDEWRMCLCGASGGQYNADGMTATIGGRARVFGVGNTFFNELYPLLGAEAKKMVRQKYFGQETDAWWGEYKGDQQIFRIKSAKGPRLKVEMKLVVGRMVDIIVVDKRDYWIDGEFLKESVRVPQNPGYKPPRKRKPKKKETSEDVLSAVSHGVEKQ
jgi:hypothetical protein